MPNKSPKGSVAIGEVDGRFRLRWQSFDEMKRPKRFTLPCGAVNGVNRSAAERLARQIELDIASGNFDPSLRKYKHGYGSDSSLSVDALMERYIKTISPEKTSSVDRYKTLRNHLLKFQGKLSVDGCTEKKAVAFMGYLQDCGQGGETVNMNLTCIRAVWNWAIKKGLAKSNPWLDLRVDVDPRESAKPFTLEEIHRILEAFEDSHYRDFVTFLMGVGCRIGEAVALDWASVSEDCSEVWIAKSFDLRSHKIKTTKTNEARSVPLSPKIQSLLLRLKETASSSFVFPSPKGKRIDRNNFRRSYWKPTLERLEIEYRSPYHTRHTRWSHEISTGNLDIATAAKYAGNRPRTMLDRYLGSTKRPRLSDL
ncbi:site-specific integrase [Leptolyngbya sp. FACHB-17]|uniref:site-specific integrase n=1 Tax=unclassified Leptolyngbya TaxID=2650499 RepID=UPI0016802521|nr:site-specific integrase [Leptolyngbya sp. FACHB-17]MBD2079601.1 tyrosine-type recombinase/integrase [Leptolyngbya sp. FACHB-17]